ncbi:hypothetical protein LCGC14_1058760 [marine sediment metagenome]|uniref:Bacterial repeat domain-containing protein n=1 Tax=marine sediment metagenome TaxID=412755 RepID=A0A0F9N8L8_9ZZZZ
MAAILHVTIVPAGTGGVEPSPGGDYISPGTVSYPEGTVLTLRAVAFTGYFHHWEGDAAGTDNPTAITMDSDKEVIAVFEIPEEIPTYQLTADVLGSGIVVPSEGTYGAGGQAILVATPGAGNVFNGWLGDTEGTTPVPGMPNQLVVTMDRDRHITAHFVEAAPEFSGFAVKEYERISNAGEVGVKALLGEKLTVQVGDTVRIRLMINYRGPDIDGAVWVAIGRQNAWFNEDFNSRTPAHFDPSSDFVPYEIVADVVIDDRPGTDYDMYAKIMEVPGPDIFTPGYLNVIDVIGAAEFGNFTIDSYEKV